jgi:hypothetical protein
MGWFNDAWSWIMKKVSTFISESSWLHVAGFIGTVIIVLIVIGIVVFWWLLLHKFMNHGGDH